MKTSSCECGNTLFFESVHCVGCGVDVGVCEVCSEITRVETLDSGQTQCPSCKSLVHACQNRDAYEVCNVWVKADPTTSESLCSSCRLTRVIPDLSDPENVKRWSALEAAKRRVLFILAEAGFPVGAAVESGDPPLTFEFKADDVEPVATGHANGCITINVKEANSVERERTRVEFGEPQRTLVGHFRHELGHYYWDLLVKPNRLNDFRETFGDESSPTYEDAKDQYYHQGPRADWPQEFISAYASMHPWEDFAESFGAYLDMCSVLSTARHFGLLGRGSGEVPKEFEAMMTLYQRVGIIVNELNRDMGLLDLVPEVFNKPVRRKLEFIHSMKCQVASNAPCASGIA